MRRRPPPEPLRAAPSGRGLARRRPTADEDGARQANRRRGHGAAQRVAPGGRGFRGFEWCGIDVQGDVVVLAASSSEADEAVGVDVMRLDEEDAG